jgi:hypothetical protein
MHADEARRLWTLKYNERLRNAEAEIKAAKEKAANQKELAYQKLLQSVFTTIKAVAEKGSTRDCVIDPHDHDQFRLVRDLKSLGYGASRRSVEVPIYGNEPEFQDRVVVTW